MPSQLRIYDIKRDLMDEWLAFFQAKVVPMHDKHGMPAYAAWVDRERSQFVWVRTFTGEGSVEEQEKRYYESDERQAVIGDEPKRFIQAMQVRVVERVHPLP
ncbi:NIPSNAP family protein [Geodermatophilus sp. SYSU D00703]